MTSIPQTPNWFSESSEQTGTAFSLQIRQHLHHETTPYQTIDIYDTTTFGHLMCIDGLTMVTERDNFIYHEMLSHPALHTHPGPKAVAIIGGGDCGTLQEVLKHPQVQYATQIEIDERVTRLSEKYFPELCQNNRDPRARFLFADGIQWVKEQANDSLDVLIIDSTDPIGPAEGLFTQSFYEQACRILHEDGLLVQQSESPLLHPTLIKAMHEAMKGAGFAYTATLTFPLCSYPSGWWSATLAAKKPIPTQLNPDKYTQDSFNTRYYNSSIHSAAFALPEFLKASLQTT